MRMVEAMPNPNTNAVSRNITMLALEVAASAPSPRRRPTQIALMVPFSDWRIELASVGSAKASRVLAIGPSVRLPRPDLRFAPASAMLSLPEPLQRSAEAFGLSRLGVVVRARFLHRLGLGPLREVRI